MPSTYSPDLRIELIANGEQSGTWGSTTNNNLGTLIEDAISGVASVFVTAASQALTAANGTADQARCAALVLSTSVGANFAVYAPPVTKIYIVKNNSAYIATIYASTVLGNTTAAGSGVAIPAGKTALVRCDGVNFLNAVDSFTSSVDISGALAVGAGATVETSLDVGTSLTVGTDATIEGSSAIGGSVTVGEDAVVGVRIAATYTQTATTVTVSTSPTEHGFTTGDVVAFINNGGVGVNGSFTVTVINVVSFSFTSPTSQATSGNCFVTKSGINLNGVLSAGVVVEGATTIPALRITQTGSGNALVVEDETSPDSTPFVVNSLGGVVRGHTATINLVNPDTGSANGPFLESVATSIGGASYGSVLYVNNAGQAGYYALAKSRGATIGDMTALQSGDTIGFLSWQGSDGTNFIRAADIQVEVDGTPGTNDMPGRLVFSTTADGASVPTEKFRISNFGGLGVGGANFGTVGQVLVSGGAAAAPAWGSAVASLAASVEGAVGTYALLGHGDTVAGNFGELIAGSKLYPTGTWKGSTDGTNNAPSASNNGDAWMASENSVRAGTWKCMGYTRGANWNITLWLRVA